MKLRQPSNLTKATCAAFASIVTGGFRLRSIAFSSNAAEVLPGHVGSGDCAESGMFVGQGCDRRAHPLAHLLLHRCDEPSDLAHRLKNKRPGGHLSSFCPRNEDAMPAERFDFRNAAGQNLAALLNRPDARGTRADYWSQPRRLASSARRSRKSGTKMRLK